MKSTITSFRKDPVLDLIEESFDLFEAEEPRVQKIMGFPYPEYVSLLMFVDAFADAAIKDSPTVAEKFQTPGRDLLENVLDYFDEIGLDIFDYASESMGLDLIDRINELWGENFSVDALIQYDKDALGTVVLIALGHDVRLDADVRRVLKDHDAKEPTAENLGIDHDERRYKAAYKALSDIHGMKTESRDDLSESFLGFFGGKEKEQKPEKSEAKAQKLLETILKQLNIKYHLDKEKGHDGTVFRHHLTINKKHYVLKSYIISDSQHLSSVLWDEEEDNFFVVVTIGYLKDYYALIAFGRQRLKAWMEKEHGRTRHE
jgi:hypothetical protein